MWSFHSPEYLNLILNHVSESNDHSESKDFESAPRLLRSKRKK